MSFPTPFTVSLHSYSPGADDGYGNPLPVYTPPKDEDGTPYRVFGWVTSAPPVESRGGEDRVIIALQLFAPTSFPANAYDVVDVDGTLFEIIGSGEDYISGPWWNPKMVVWNLQSVIG